MAPLNGSNDVEALYNGSNGHNSTAGSPAIQSAFVDSRSGKQVDVEKVRMPLLHRATTPLEQLMSQQLSCQSRTMCWLQHLPCQYMQ